MAKSKKKSVKSKKIPKVAEEFLEAPFVDAPISEDFSGYTQTVEEMLNEVVVHQVTKPNMVLAEQLEGIPKIFDEKHSSDFRVLVAEGIAADYGDKGFARGCHWRGKVHKRNKGNS